MSFHQNSSEILVLKFYRNRIFTCKITSFFFLFFFCYLLQLNNLKIMEIVFKIIPYSYFIQYNVSLKSNINICIYYVI